MKAGRLLAAMAALGAAMLLAWPRSALAQTESVQRERIARERAAVEAMYARQERECQVRFAVTACVEDARRMRRNDLASCGARPTRSTRRSASSVPSGAARPSGTTRPRKRSRQEPWRRSRRANLAPCRCNGHQRPPLKPARCLERIRPGRRRRALKCRSVPPRRPQGEPTRRKTGPASTNDSVRRRRTATRSRGAMKSRLRGASPLRHCLCRLRPALDGARSGVPGAAGRVRRARERQSGSTLIKRQRNVIAAAMGTLACLVDQHFTRLTRAERVHDRAELFRGEVVPKAIAAAQDGVADVELDAFVRTAAGPGAFPGSPSAGWIGGGRWRLLRRSGLRRRAVARRSGRRCETPVSTPRKW